MMIMIINDSDFKICIVNKHKEISFFKREHKCYPFHYCAKVEFAQAPHDKSSCVHLALEKMPPLLSFVSFPLQKNKNKIKKNNNNNNSADVHMVTFQSPF